MLLELSYLTMDHPQMGHLAYVSLSRYPWMHWGYDAHPRTIHG